jgi:molecular chaperone DnaK (HSP70)
MKYVIGIDLGTTNSALAYTEIKPGADAFDTPEVRLMDVPQLVNPGEVRDEPLLPSSLFIPGATDFPAGALALPWNAEPEFVTGQLAQKRGVENAGRLVASAKSWLSHSGVDRTAPIPKAFAKFRRSTPRPNISSICVRLGISKCPMRPSSSSKSWSPFPHPLTQ